MLAFATGAGALAEVDADEAPPAASRRSGSSCSPSACGPRRARRSRSSAREGVELQGALRRPARDGRRDRRRRRHPGRAAAARRRASCPRTGERCARRAARATVIGRISPEGKRRVVEALARRGPLRRDGRRRRERRARAEGGAARDRAGQRRRRWRESVADLVLVGGDFARGAARWSPRAARSLRNLQRVAKLFVTKSAFAAFLILLDRADADGLPAAAAPPHARRDAHDRHPDVLPRARAERRALPGTEGFLRDVARFAVPAGAAAGLGVVSGYLFALNVARPAARSRRARWPRPCSSSSASTSSSRSRRRVHASRRGGVGARGRARRRVWARALVAVDARILRPVGDDARYPRDCAWRLRVVLTVLWLADARFAPGRAHEAK